MRGGLVLAEGGEGRETLKTGQGGGETYQKRELIERTTGSIVISGVPSARMRTLTRYPKNIASRPCDETHNGTSMCQ